MLIARTLTTLAIASSLVFTAGPVSAEGQLLQVDSQTTTPVRIRTESPILTFPGITLGYGTGELVDGVLTYELVYLIDMGELAQATLDTTGTITDGEPPTNLSSASACSGSALICDPIEVDVVDEITFVSGGPLSLSGTTTLTTPPSSSGNSGPTTWTITAGESTAIPVTVDSFAEYPESVGTAVGTGTGELDGGVLTYEMEYVLDLTIFERTSMTIYGTLFDGAPPTGVTAVSECEGSELVCGDLALGTFRPESFETGGPFSETEPTLLTTGVSASGRTPPSTLTISPVVSEDGASDVDETVVDEAQPPVSDDVVEQPVENDAPAGADRAAEVAVDAEVAESDDGDTGLGWTVPLVIVGLLAAGATAYGVTRKKAERRP